MGLIIEVRGFTPDLCEDTYVAENATIVGEVICGNECSFWFSST